MAVDSQASFVSRALVEPEPPPVASADTLAWTRLFGGVLNATLTIVSATVIVALLWPALKFLVIDAVWVGTQLSGVLVLAVAHRISAGGLFACWGLGATAGATVFLVRSGIRPWSMSSWSASGNSG